MKDHRSLQTNRIERDPHSQCSPKEKYNQVSEYTLINHFGCRTVMICRVNLERPGWEAAPVSQMQDVAAWPSKGRTHLRYEGSGNKRAAWEVWCSQGRGEVLVGGGGGSCLA